MLRVGAELPLLTPDGGTPCQAGLPEEDVLSSKTITCY